MLKIVNDSTSEDHQLLAGTSQGDPKSSPAFNGAAAPLNHYLASSPTVPRYEFANNEQVSPVYFADDDLLLLKGDQVDLIIRMIEKYHNTDKCQDYTLI